MSDISDAVLKSFDIEAECVIRQKNALDMEAVLKAIDILAGVVDKGKIVMTGAGSCSIASRKIVHTFGSLRLPCMYLSPTTAIHGSLGTLQHDDVLILLSRGGKSKELDAFVQYGKKQGSTIIAVTENPGSEIARAVDLVIPMHVYAESDPGNIFATGSVMVFLAIFDAIAAGLWHKLGYTTQLFADIHPGGAVGERLNSK